MSKKDYILIANAIRFRFEFADARGKELLLLLADDFRIKLGNERAAFDHDRFMLAAVNAVPVPTIRPNSPHDPFGKAYALAAS